MILFTVSQQQGHGSERWLITLKRAEKAIHLLGHSYVMGLLKVSLESIT